MEALWRRSPSALGEIFSLIGGPCFGWWWLGGWGLVKAVEIAARTCSSRAEGPSKPHELMSSLIVSISRRRASSSHCNTTFS